MTATSWATWLPQMPALLEHFRVLRYDTRGHGQSEVTPGPYSIAQLGGDVVALLDHLKIDKAHIMGGCMGCSPVIAMGTQAPERVLSMVIYWPVGGPKYRMSSHQRFAEHLAFVHQNGMQAVVDLIKRDGKAFGADPRGGPWASVIKADRAFADTYAQLDVEKYKHVVVGMVRGLMDRDTAPGAEPEDMMRCELPAIIVPGSDNFHATSAARYLQECLPNARYWDMAPAGQSEEATRKELLDFLGSV